MKMMQSLITEQIRTKTIKMTMTQKVAHEYKKKIKTKSGQVCETHCHKKGKIFSLLTLDETIMLKRSWKLKTEALLYMYKMHIAK